MRDNKGRIALEYAIMLKRTKLIEYLAGETIRSTLPLLNAEVSGLPRGSSVEDDESLHLGVIKKHLTIQGLNRSNVVIASGYYAACTLTEMLDTFITAGYSTCVVLRIATYRTHTHSLSSIYRQPGKY